MSTAGEGFDSAFFVDSAERNPLRRATQAGEKPRLRRFFKEAATAPAESGFIVTLDGKPVKTPARKALWAPTQALAEALAGEWAGQGEEIDPAAMPLTRLFNSALDGVAERLEEVEADVVRHAACDLICYRADEPETLVARQSAAWDPYLAFARDAFGAKFLLAEGAMFQAQPPAAVAAVAAGVRAYVGAGDAAALRLAALHTKTTLTGSCLIALAVALQRAAVEDAWRAAHVDEDFQLAVWGADADAMARREARYVEMRAAALLAAGAR
jgi:chaperone required for assembly of F1-ATPase